MIVLLLGSVKCCAYARACVRVCVCMCVQWAVDYPTTSVPSQMCEINQMLD